MKNAKTISKYDLTMNFFCGVTKHRSTDTGVNFVVFQSRESKFASCGAGGTSRIDQCFSEIINKINFIDDETKEVLSEKAHSGHYSSIFSGITQEGMSQLAKDLGFNDALVIDNPQYNPTNLKPKSLTMIRFI